MTGLAGRAIPLLEVTRSDRPLCLETGAVVRPMTAPLTSTQYELHCTAAVPSCLGDGGGLFLEVLQMSIYVVCSRQIFEER